MDHRFDHIDWPQYIADVYDRQYPKRAIPQIGRFQGSATEQEIWCGALSAIHAERHVIACFREISNRDDFSIDEVKDFFDRTFYPTQGQVTDKPYAAFVTHGGGGRAIQSIESVAQSFKFKKA
ncbi:MAG: hypothetical protein HGA94_06160, partial [Candidatus Aminicenantes bacterium]|nr:hypothetical protein [Candidatus Aminicenantes bacterium]